MAFVDMARGDWPDLDGLSDELREHIKHDPISQEARGLDAPQAVTQFTGPDVFATLVFLPLALKNLALYPLVLVLNALPILVHKAWAASMPIPSSIIPRHGFFSHFLLLQRLLAAPMFIVFGVNIIVDFIIIMLCSWLFAALTGRLGGFSLYGAPGSRVAKARSNLSLYEKGPPISWSDHVVSVIGAVQRQPYFAFLGKITAMVMFNHLVKYILVTK